MFSKTEVAKIKQMLSQPQPKPKRKVRARKSRRSNSVNLQPTQDGMVRLKRDDLLFSLSAAKSTEATNYKAFNPADATLGVLHKFSQIFECYKIHSASVYYVPALGKVMAGQVIVGIDYGSKNSVPITKPNMLTLQHRVVQAGTAFRGFKVTIDPNIVRYTDSSDENRDKPFIIHALATGLEANKVNLVGDVMITYDITFYGLKPQQLIPPPTPPSINERESISEKKYKAINWWEIRKDPNPRDIHCYELESTALSSEITTGFNLPHVTNELAPITQTLTYTQNPYVSKVLLASDNDPNSITLTHNLPPLAFTDLAQDELVVFDYDFHVNALGFNNATINLAEFSFIIDNSVWQTIVAPVVQTKVNSQQGIISKTAMLVLKALAARSLKYLPQVRVVVKLKLPDYTADQIALYFAVVAARYIAHFQPDGEQIYDLSLLFHEEDDTSDSNFEFV